MKSKINKKIIVPTIIAIAGIGYLLTKNKGKSTDLSQYEGKLLYAEDNKWQSIFIQNGVAYLLATNEAWNSFNKKINLITNKKIVSRDLYNSFPIVGNVSDNGELVKN